MKYIDYFFQTEISKTNIRVSELKKGVQTGLANSGRKLEIDNLFFL